MIIAFFEKLFSSRGMDILFSIWLIGIGFCVLTLAAVFTIKMVLTL